MERPRDNLQLQRPRPTDARYARRPPLRQLDKPLAEKALSARLKQLQPAGMKVQRSISLYAAVARALKIPDVPVAQVSSRIFDLCPFQAEDEEGLLKGILAEIACHAQVWDADETRDRLVSAHPDPIAKLQLCCIYGRFHGAGVGLGQAELEKLKAKIPNLFSAPAEQHAVSGAPLPIDLEVQVVHSSSSEAESDSEPEEFGGPGRRHEGHESSLALAELKKRGDFAIHLLHDALKTIEGINPAQAIEDGGARSAQGPPQLAIADAAVRHDLPPAPCTSSSGLAAAIQLTNEDMIEQMFADMDRASATVSLGRPFVLSTVSDSGNEANHRRSSADAPRVDAAGERNARPVLGAVDIPIRDGGRLIGTEGRHIKELEAEHGVHIKVPKIESDDVEAMMTIEVTGDDEGLDACLRAIKNLYHLERVKFHSVQDFERDVKKSVADLSKLHRVEMNWSPATCHLVIFGRLDSAQSAAKAVRSMLDTTMEVEIGAALVPAFEAKRMQIKLNKRKGIRTVSLEDGVVQVNGKAWAVERALHKIFRFRRQRRPLQRRRGPRETNQVNSLDQIIQRIAPDDADVMREIWQDI
ncbi:KH domain-containing protein [Durusdinium trenchii]|uniref:KH domain-containing protein n=1 Tax=Durusdinium trenchii TaxID=1381693 RepID=A0ABP0JRG9_9DINO